MKTVIGTLLVFLIGLTTYKGFIDRQYFERYVFNVDEILIGRQWSRLISSGFLHVSWLHYGFNMVALLAFSWSLEVVLGVPKYLLIYVGSLIGGNLLALYIHRIHGDYRAVGASGAISGIIFSAIILFPDIKISLILLPLEMPTWLFGALFVLVSILGIKSQSDNIGHDAHLGGAIVGILLTCLLEPSVLRTSWWLVLLVLLPTTAFLLLIVRNPAVLMVDNYWGESVKNIGRRPTRRRKKRLNLDDILDKVKRKGVDALTPEEKAFLDRFSE
ncbi:MAG: rhomboid family intramembrane serine protease [Bacteroidota bacterium]